MSIPTIAFKLFERKSLFRVSAEKDLAHVGVPLLFRHSITINESVITTSMAADKTNPAVKIH